MVKTVDARSLSCPQPVMLTMDALAKADEVITIVDNQAARENVARFGKSQGCEVSIEQKEEGIYLTLNKAKVESPNGEARSATSTVLFIGNDNATSPRNDFWAKLVKGRGSYYLQDSLEVATYRFGTFWCGTPGMYPGLPGGHSSF